MDIEQELKKIKEEVIDCRKCPLHKERIENGFYPVVGEGNHQTKIIFVGEAPGLNEAKTGRPFCGAAGKILDELLESVSIKREDVYICNILKCRPFQNRDPQKEEIKACAPYLERQIEIVSPEVICPLGNFATRFIFKKYDLEDQLEGISKIHGKVFEPQITAEDIQSSLFEQKRREAKDFKGKLKIIPLYHPAVATYNANMKEILKKDFQVLKKFSCKKK